MLLSRYTIKNIISPSVFVPDEDLFHLPEKVLQFGTGSLLRSLPDYVIDKANHQGVFNGRIVAVACEPNNNDGSLNKQDGLYTLCLRGEQNGDRVEENTIVCSISRVLQVQQNWKEVLACAHNINMQVIISGAAATGIHLVPDDIHRHPPLSFPGQLLAFLYERYKAFNGSERSGMVIVPTEMIPGNGHKLEAIVLELAHLNGLEDGFIEWLENCNHFCNSVVDVTVAGKPDAAMQQALENDWGYTDSATTLAGLNRLWAIEGGEEVKRILSFAAVDERITIEAELNPLHQSKIALLNAAQILGCGLSFLTGFDTVNEAIDDEALSAYLIGLVQNELSPLVFSDTDAATAQTVSTDVLRRLGNPYIPCRWTDIAVQYTAKMRLHVVPLLLQHFGKEGTVPDSIAAGFAGYLQLLKPLQKKGDAYYGERAGTEYPIDDNCAEIFYNRWQTTSPYSLAEAVLSDRKLWGTDLNALPGFTKAVAANLEGLANGDINTVPFIHSQKNVFV